MAHSNQMSKKRVRPRTVNAAPPTEVDAARLLELPTEVLLEIWEELGPIERVCVSQICSSWRRIALGIPKFWAQLAFVHIRPPSTARPADARAAADRPRRPKPSILHPALGSCNMSFFETALRRSGEFPLDLSMLGTSYSPSLPPRFCFLIKPHAHRIARVHSSYPFWIYCLLELRPDWPALRTLTGGFDDRAIIFSDLPSKTAPERAFPDLRQIHFSGHYPCTELFDEYTFHCVSELSFAPYCVSDIIIALAACPCLSSLTLLFTYFKKGERFHDAQYTTFLEHVLPLRYVRICGITSDSEPLLLATFDDKLLPNVTFDYQDRGDISCRALVSPCGSLEDPLHINLALREGAYALTVTDSAQRRRCVLLNSSSISRSSGLWDCYIRDKAVHSATVDALAWHYFVDDIPDDCPLPELTINVGYTHTELKNVSLARLPCLTKLGIATFKPAIKFPPRVVNSLVQSRPRESLPLTVLSLARNCEFGAEETFAQLADVVERPAA